MFSYAIKQWWQILSQFLISYCALMYNCFIHSNIVMSKMVIIKCTVPIQIMQKIIYLLREPLPRSKCIYMSFDSHLLSKLWSILCFWTLLAIALQEMFRLNGFKSRARFALFRPKWREITLTVSNRPIYYNCTWHLRISGSGQAASGWPSFHCLKRAILPEFSVVWLS